MKWIKGMIAVAVTLWLGMGASAVQAQTPPAQGAAAPAPETPQAGSATTAAPAPAASTPTAPAAKKKSDQLDTVVVQDTAVTPDQAAAHDLQQVPGGTNLITSQTAKTQRNYTISDLLAGQAGVYTQAANGNPAVKISIRGSGVNTGQGFFRTGILFLFDGLPLTSPGGTPYELLDPNGVSYTEILRGANGFNYQSEQLGGVIAFTTHTGYDSSPFQARFDAGSFGYIAGQVSSGLVEGPYDYYVSADGSASQGYQNWSEAKAAHVVANVGDQIDENIDNRFFFRWGYTYNQQPGSITKAQLEANGRTANPTSIAEDSYRVQPGSYWIADKVTDKIDPDSSISTGVVFHSFPINQFSYGRVGTSLATTAHWWYTVVAGVARYDREDTLFADHDSKSNFGVMFTGEPSAGEKVYDSTDGVAYNDLLRNRNFDGSADGAVTSSNQLELVPNLWLNSGLGGVYTRRVSDAVLNNYLSVASATAPIVFNQGTASKTDYTLLDWQGNEGFRYDITPDWNAYTSVSRIIDTPNDWALYNTPSASEGSLGGTSQYLKNQSATTIEVGTKGKEGIFNGSVDFYRSWVDNELLTVTIQQSPAITASSNASPTIHQGVEAQLDTTLWQEKGLPDYTPHRLIFKQSYTYSDDYFANDPTWGTNKEPGIPTHYYQAELRYEHPTGLYVGLDANVASHMAIDYANTLYTDAYETYGVKVGYIQPKGGFEAHLELRNITNETYAATVSPVYNAGGSPTSSAGAALTPGDGFGVYGGVSYEY